MVVLDTDGRVVRDALLWNDTRSAQAARDLVAEFGPEALAERTGSVPVASFTATKLRWLRDAEPENAARVAAVALPHDWLTWRLLGYGPVGESPLGPDLSKLTTDRSDASGTSYWSPDTGGYDRELLVAVLGRDAILPRVLAPDERAAETVAHRGIPAGIVVGPGAGDNAGAALGLGAVAGDVVVSIGTSGTVFAVTTEPVRDASGTVAGFADASGVFSRSSPPSTPRGSSTRSPACSASATTSSDASRSPPSPAPTASSCSRISRASAPRTSRTRPPRSTG